MAVSCAFAVINGLQVLRCSLPSPSERVCEVYADADQQLNVMNDFGRLEISCLFYASSHSAEKQSMWVGTLKVDYGPIEEFLLGKVPSEDGKSVLVCRYVGAYPKRFILSLRYAHSEERCPHPEEGTLCDEMTQLFAQETFSFQEDGFVRLSHIKNKLSSLEIYRRVVGSGKSSGFYNRNFLQFVSAHPEKFTIKPVPGGECLVALHPSLGKDFGRTSPADTVQIDMQIVAALQNFLFSGSKRIDEVVAHLVRNAAFRSTLRASSSTFSQFIRRHSDTFWITVDPVHTTRVGLRRSAATT